MYMQESPNLGRKRAYSEACNPVLVNGQLDGTFTIGRVQSDGDLSRIDRVKTFERADSMFESTNILAQVVSALGAIRPTDDDGNSVLDIAVEGGIHGFSDSQILASERTWSGWSLPHSDGSYANTPKQRRARAASAFCAPSFADPDNDPHEWTWSGNNAHIQEFLNKKTKTRKQSLFRTAFMGSEKLDPSRSVTISIPDQDSRTPEMNSSILSKINPFKKRVMNSHAKRHSLTGQEFDSQRYLERTARGRESKVSMFTPKQYLQATARGRQSAFSILPSARDVKPDVLETTTIADLIRALEVVHTKAQDDQGSPLLGRMYESPRRKMGTASLTPPKMSSPIVQSKARRGSLKPVPTYTTVFNSRAANMRRRKSHVSTADDMHRSLSDHPEQPPPYVGNESPRPLKRRFSVRPTNLLIPPGQAPPTLSTSALQRRISLKPSPLARTTMGQSSGRFSRSNFQTTTPAVTPSGLTHRFQASVTPILGRNTLWPPVQLHGSRTRHGSVSDLYEQNERKRSESK